MQPTVELVAVSDHEWIVADDDAVLGVVEEHAGDFEAMIDGQLTWHPHFDSLHAAERYFSEYSFALHLGRE